MSNENLSERKLVERIRINLSFCISYAFVRMQLRLFVLLLYYFSLIVTFFRKNIKNTTKLIKRIYNQVNKQEKIK